MKNISARKGSALLIVLGMVAVMVISAVAFSAYMRYSRLPSSYLRRTSASRHLAHAAMAEAIDIIDASIGDNPHPGVGLEATLYPRKTGSSAIRNYWRDHCYIGTSELVSSEDTASVLTLEALAYIPPALVNEVRYYSRHSPAASWQRLGYDSGRFAFCAIDVSDHFDVNRILADIGRNSSDGGKFSLAFAFENDTHKSYTISPSDWDGFLNEYVDIEALRFPWKAPSKSKMPFVSLADLNLAMYSKDKTMASSLCPFITYIASESNEERRGFDDVEFLESADMIRRFNIISDGLYPSSAVTENSKHYDISRNQPFTSMKDRATNHEVLSYMSEFARLFNREGFSMLDIIALYDYLDKDNIPVSLALPTVERAPMICGLEVRVPLTLEPGLEKEENPKKEDINEVGKTYKERSTGKLKVSSINGAFAGLYMFPFRSDRDDDGSGYKAEYSFRICFGTESPGFRISDVVTDSSYFVKSSDFKASGVAGGAMRLAVSEDEHSFGDVKKPEDAFAQKKTLRPNFNDVKSWFDGADLFWVEKTFELDHIDEVTGEKVWKELTDERNAWVNPDFYPVDKNGVRVVSENLEDKLKAGKSILVTPYMTITSRITKGTDTLDLVPASYYDDKDYNNVNSDQNLANLCGNARPIMTFCGDRGMEFGLESFDKGESIDVVIKPKDSMSVFCPDPRWNFAPENFVGVNEPLDKEWYTAEDNARCGVGNKDEGRDGDIFMFVSNQGYMQSVSELAFLPRTTFRCLGIEDSNSITGNAGFSPNPNDSSTDFSTDINGTANGRLMWRTYRLYDKHEVKPDYASDDLYNHGFFDGGRGFRMTPYTRSRSALLAAFANTPCSWWAASTNDSCNAGLKKKSAQEFNNDYAFNAIGSENKDSFFDWKDLERVADRIGVAMRSDKKGDWCKGYDSLDWGGNNESTDLFGKTYIQDGKTCDLYEIDRKFLYGYWRDCFAAKQQLFLVFVRAEPMMMGGGAAGQAPPQLGARAMALVWRNPAAGSHVGVTGGKKPWPESLDVTGSVAVYGDLGNEEEFKQDDTTEDNPPPHQTRILFYRQFD